jgi:3-hydroxyisobutyrate dehydrogenase-like beta-hydroxyacid dehydrogenase
MWRNGCEVAVLDKDPTAVRKFIDAGVKSVENAKKLAQNCELHTLMFPLFCVMTY